ncbi:MAG TPA: alkaline phosphatase, partial [Hellea balneolensis]|nr:alkaline phosphatase [Hellea balneolensis]
MANITRRATLLSATAALGVTGSACQSESPTNRVKFNHGVASGDPARDGFVIWTRITLETAGKVDVQWEVASDKKFKKNHKKGVFTTGPGRDYTVKVELDGLTPGQAYYYRFAVGKTRSPVGRSKTLPEGHCKAARFAVVSCSNYPFGYFNVYDHIAQQELDAVIHLGDYLYEYGENGYGKRMGIELGRIHNPTHEIISLSDYRT